MRARMEYAAAWMALKGFGLLPRPVARAAGAGLARLALWLRPSLRRTALFNLKVAFPEWTDAQRNGAVNELVQQLGWLVAEFARLPRLTRENISQIVSFEGFENYLAAQRRGQGVLFLTGHTSAWELMPVAFALFHRPMYFLVRSVDNDRVNALVNSYRCRCGNQPIDKNQSARAILKILRQGGDIGILADQNTSPEEGVFVDFFGVPASASSGIARLALRTGAAVVPGLLHWDATAKKYCLRFEPAVELARTGDEEADVVENTGRFARVIENYARTYPGQWLWVHKRWKTRPPGEKPFYPF
jgi:KDO2-lipid IV(A) lauroyltransferase